MLIQTLLKLCVLSLLSGTISAAEMKVSQGDTQAAEALTAGLLRASENPESPFHLQVNCTDEKGIRSMNLFPGGTAIWNGSSQVTVPPTTRSALLRSLLNQGFPDFKESYGGRDRPEKEAAAPRISCQISIKIEDLQKISVQKAGGQQSTELTGLAAGLLDQVAPFAQDGISASNLQDALDKLLAGQLAPQSLNLRFMELPAKDKTAQGYIIRLRGGNLSRQAYSPGSSIGEAKWQALEQGQYLKLVTALQQAELANLPGNLWSEEQLELEIQVLDQKKIVLARPFGRLDQKAQAAEKQRFDTLLLSVRDLGQ